MATGFRLDMQICELVSASCRKAGFFTSLTLIQAVGMVVALLAVVVVSYMAARGGRGVERGPKQGARPKRSRGNELGSSDFADREQIRRWVTPNEKLDTILYCSELRGSHGKGFGPSKLILPNGERN
ncbi:MAG: hypothetical protein IT290_10520, partial [Deltaproteobacteria bacterium]|nr:hypothetical protein [Deltaproteobacteria bacterium]